jgi:hypothetical protein
VRSAQSYPTAAGRTSQIFLESAIVAKAIARHQREAASQGRIKETREMEALCSGVSEMVLELTRPHQQSSAA